MHSRAASLSESVLKDGRITGFTWHCLRHTFGSRLVMAGVDIRTVQELMGHKTIAMAIRYSHRAPKPTPLPTPGLLEQSATQSTMLQ
jgi:site-specific recombinase XerD